MTEDLVTQMAEDAAQPAEAEGGIENLTELGHELEMLKGELDRIDAEKKVVQERYDTLRKSVIPDLMHSAGIARDGRGSFTTSTGARISLRNDLYAGYRKEDESRVFEWLREEGMGDLIRETLHNATLKAMVRERMADGKPLPEFITQYYETKVQLTLPRK